MIEIIALFMIIVFYVVPLNLILYTLCERFGDYLLKTYPDPPFKFLLYISCDYLPPALYITFFVLLFLLLYFLLTNVVRKSLFVFKNIDMSEWSLIKYSKGQKSINLTARILIVLILALQCYFKVIDVKIIVLGILCLLFIFKELKPRKVKKITKIEKKPEESDIQKELAEDKGGDYIDFNWSYLLDALSIKRPIVFNVRFSKEDNHVVQDKETGIEVQKNVKAFAEEIKSLCDLNSLDNFHKTSAVFSLLSKFKYIRGSDNEEISKQAPAETLERQEGDGYSLGVCAAAILRAMNIKVIELKLPLKEGGSKLALAVEGADELIGNYYINEDKQYFYCELREDNSFRVGEVPEENK